MVTARRPGPEPRLDVGEVRAALAADVAGVLERIGWPVKRAGSQLEGRACPARPDHSRRSAFKISPVTGRWRCFSCGTDGDLFDVIAAHERLSAGRDFPVVLARAAELAGVAPSTASEDERRARREALERARAARAAAEHSARAAMERDAIPRATRVWAALGRTDPAGAAYLASRDLAAAARLCRFDRRLGGSPAIPLFTRDGQIRNVVRRVLPDVLARSADPDRKTPGLWQCPTAGTLLGALHRIGPGMLAVATEGFADTLTAALAWPRAVPLGAHGVDNLPAVVRAAALRCARVGARLALVRHHDEPGMRRAAEAVELAEAAGLRVADGTLEVVDYPEIHKDLNDAWCAGWRPAV